MLRLSFDWQASRVSKGEDDVWVQLLVLRLGGVPVVVLALALLVLM